MNIDITTPEMDEAEALTDLWVALARGQHEYGSYLADEGNRSPIYESICQHIVTGDILVARVPGRGLGDSSTSNCDAESDRGADRDHADIVGFVMFAAKKGQYREAVPMGIIENLYVVPAQRGKGIGSALFVGAEDALKSDGTAVITLDVMAANKAARRFYARHGYDTHRITMAKRQTDTHSKDER